MALELRLLRVENMVAPIALLAERPRFSWQLVSDMRGTKQSAYHIVVTAGGEVVWDTGHVESEETINIRYSGSSLAPLTRYDWTVTVWDNQNNSTMEHSWWETSREGLPWQAKWVEPEQEPTPISADESDLEESLREAHVRNWHDFKPPQFLRLVLPIKSGLLRARLFVSAHGIYRLELNGARVDDREFAPEITPYDHMLQYQTYDLTDSLSAGENLLGIVLADGWWIGRVGVTGGCCQFGDRLGLLLEARLEYENGDVEIVSGEQCVSATGPLLYSDLFVGEKYDARKELTGWSMTDFDDIN